MVTSLKESLRQAMTVQRISLARKVRPILRRFIAYIQKAEEAEKDPREFIP